MHLLYIACIAPARLCLCRCSLMLFRGYTMAWMLLSSVDKLRLCPCDCSPGAAQQLRKGNPGCLLGPRGRSKICCAADAACSGDSRAVLPAAKDC